MGIDWTLDHLERDLSAGFSYLDAAERSGSIASGEANALAEGVLRCMNGALQKVSESLDAQAALRREVDRLREEHKVLRREFESRLASLKGELETLRGTKVKPGQGAGQGAEGQPYADDQPDAAHLSRPLVLRSAQGDFLGVADGQGRRLTLEGFVRLVERKGAPGRVVGTVWERSPFGWTLVASVLSPSARRVYTLETRSVLTPSGNRVTLLDRVAVDGRNVPRDYVAQMFRQLRDGFQEN